MSSAVTYFRTAERPDLRLWLLDDDSALVDLSSGYTFEFKVGHPGSAAVVTKTSGMTGAAGSGTVDSGTPNLTVTFSAGDWDSPTAATYTWQVKATTGGKDRFWQGEFELRDVVS